jgi:purine-nucleoside phosphorylase
MTDSTHNNKIESAIPTPHIEAAKVDFADVVLMPGDPMRAKFIADNFLEDAKLVTAVRGMFGYTGTYKGVRVSVMGSGMGVPSMGIYSYELFNFYDVKKIIRIGTCGAISKDLQIFDIVASMAASYDTSFVKQYKLPGTYSAASSYELLRLVDDTAKKLGMKLHVGSTVTCDSFYDESAQVPSWRKMNIIAVEMEAAGLYMVAAAAGKEALALMTISDKVEGSEGTTSEQREQSLTNMITLALETAIA